MIDLNNIKYIYFLGVGGIGMSALARYFNIKKKVVAGYDKTPTKLTEELIAEGINIHFEDGIQFLPEFIKANLQETKSTTLVIHTPAVPKSHSEYRYFQENGFKIIKRSEALGLIAEQLKTIAVAGTHGKTTTSSLVAHILKTANIDCSAFLGGITQNYHTNLLVSKSNTSSTPVVVEADEYDRSFLTLFPYIAAITSVDADHLDIYGDSKHMIESYELFAKQVNQSGALILKTNVRNKIKVTHPNIITYSINEQADYTIKNLEIKNGEYHYDMDTPKGAIKNVTIGLPGSHNVENALAATAIAQQLDVSDEKIRLALKTFKGVKRRFEYQIKSEKLIFIDDYAHHPEELKACISSVRELYPNKKITGIFQPHLFSRTRDFKEEFAKSLSLLDELILMEIYPARELPIEGVSSAMLLENISISNKKLCQKTELLSELKNRSLEVLLTLGAGDIDTFVEPIKQQLEKN